MIIVTTYPNLQGTTITATGIIDWGQVFGTGGVPVIPTFETAVLASAKQRILKRRRRRR